MFSDQAAQCLSNKSIPFITSRVNKIGTCLPLFPLHKNDIQSKNKLIFVDLPKKRKNSENYFPLRYSSQKVFLNVM